MRDDAAAARKAAESLKRMRAARKAGLPPALQRLADEAIADGYGVGGPKQGSELHRVKSIGEIMARIDARRGAANAA